MLLIRFYSYGKLFLRGRLIISLCIGAFLTGCGSYPKYTTEVHVTGRLDSIDGIDKQTKESITVEDMGEVHAASLANAIEIQLCRNGSLQYTGEFRTVRNAAGQYVRRPVPVIVSVNPLEFLKVYARRIRIHNGTEHSLQLRDVDVVLIDAADNENDMLSKSLIDDLLDIQWPCPNRNKLKASLAPVSIFSGNFRIRPNREKETYIFFQPITFQSSPGEWYLQFHNFPVRTNEAGHVIRKTSFEFLFIARKVTTGIRFRRDGYFSDWREIERKTTVTPPLSVEG